MVEGLADDGVNGVNGASDDGESLDHVHLPHSTQSAPLMLTQLAHTIQCHRQRMTKVLLDDGSRDVPTNVHVVASFAMTIFCSPLMSIDWGYSSNPPGTLVVCCDSCRRKRQSAAV
jgi:hypothetical protein